MDANDARRDARTTNKRIDELEKRVVYLENLINDIEADALWDRVVKLEME